jgi:hypothetical protein
MINLKFIVRTWLVGLFFSLLNTWTKATGLQLYHVFVREQKEREKNKKNSIFQFQPVLLFAPILILLNWISTVCTFIRNRYDFIWWNKWNDWTELQKKKIRFCFLKIHFFYRILNRFFLDDFAIFHLKL